MGTITSALLCGISPSLSIFTEVQASVLWVGSIHPFYFPLKMLYPCQSSPPGRTIPILALSPEPRGRWSWTLGGERPRRFSTMSEQEPESRRQMRGWQMADGSLQLHNTFCSHALFTLHRFWSHSHAQLLLNPLLITPTYHP